MKSDQILSKVPKNSTIFCGLSSQSRYRAKQKGFVSVEMGLTMLVGGILIVAAILFFTDNMRKTSVSANVQQLQMIAGTAKSTYGARNEYGSVTTAVAVRGHVIPTDLRDGTNPTATNSFGSAITVVPATTGTGGANDALSLSWGNVPAVQCSDIVTSVASSMRRIAVAGTDVKPLDSPLNIATLTSQCETADNVAITFVIGRS
jgi:hypothetical protein